MMSEGMSAASYVHMNHENMIHGNRIATRHAQLTTICIIDDNLLPRIVNIVPLKTQENKSQFESNLSNSDGNTSLITTMMNGKTIILKYSLLRTYRKIDRLNYDRQKYNRRNNKRNIRKNNRRDNKSNRNKLLSRKSNKNKYR